MKKILSTLVIIVALLAIMVPSLSAGTSIKTGDVSYYFCPLGECPLSHCWIYYPIVEQGSAVTEDGGCFDVGQITYCSCHDTPEYCAAMTYCDVYVPGSLDEAAE
jgi:hypothetical protein